MNMDYKQFADLLVGAYDLHMHAAPSPFNRRMDDYELLKAADAAGMAGILLKSHYESTVERAKLANKYAGTSTVAYGSIALNWPVGGLNPYAVQNALKRGAKIIFMPTRDAANSLDSGDMPGDFFKRPGIIICDENGRLRPEIYEIMDIVKQYDAVLATGHIYPRESILLCREGRARGVRMVLTHPEFSRTRISGSVQKEMADLGVLVEKCWYNIGEKECTAEEMAGNIRTVGADRCFMTTDRGQNGRETPVEALACFAAVLYEQGISRAEMELMMRKVPKEVLG